MSKALSATPDEVLDVIQELYPEQFAHAVAELTVRKQRQYIDALEAEIAKINSGEVVVPDAHAHGHTHDD